MGGKNMSKQVKDVSQSTNLYEIAEVIQQLNPNAEIRFFACSAIGNSKVPQGVTPLLRALGDPKWRVRKSASDALVKYGEPVIAPLQQVLNITNDET